MAYHETLDGSTPLEDVIEYANSETDYYRQKGINELWRRSELAEKYERLTRALVVNATFNLDVLLTGDNVQVGTCEDFDYVRDPASHDMTPDGIAAAIIAATEASA